MALRPKKDPWVRSFSVTDPTLHPNGYTVYKVRMQAFCTLAPEETKEICAWKRYSDLKKLHTVLSTLHRSLHRPGIFPSFAEPVVFGRFNSEVIEVRCKSAHTMLQFIGSQSHLYNSPAFQNFLKISETVPCPDNQIDHCAVLSPCCVDDDETRYGARPSDVRSICPSSASANATLSTSLPPLTIQMGIGVSAPVIRSTTLLSASVDIGDSCVAPMPSSTATPSSHNALGAAYRASRDLAMFDPLNNKDETLDVAHSAEASESDVLEDLSAWADVSSPLRLPEVPAADLGLHLTSISSPDPALPIKDSLNGETFEDLPTAPSDSIAEVAPARDDYLSDAEAQVQQGERYFALGKHEVSLKHYECAVTLLIRGVQDDINEERRAAAGKRTQQYLEHAQRIAKGFLRKERGGGSSSDSTGANSSASSDAVLAAPSLRLGAVSFDLPSRSMWLTAGENDVRRQGNLRGSVEELSNYKVLGVIDKVMLVLDKLNEQTYVMKVLQKNELADQSVLRMHHTIPTNCPHMVRIHRYYETDSTIYLLLQHASGGRLWSYASSYLHSHSGSSVRPRLLSSKNDSDNVYSGRRCAAAAAADSMLDVEATAPAATEQGECSKAYLDLLYDTSRLAPKTNCDDGSIASLIQEPSSEDDSSHHSGRRTTATVDQQLSTPLSRSTSDPSTTKFSVAAGAATASNAAPAARRWSVASDELGLPPPPPSLHRLASSAAAAARHQSVPESCVRQWAAEILAAVVHLHSLGVVCRDLRPDNVLLGEGGHVLLTFFGKWVGVRGAVHADALRDFYAAPELQKPLTPGASVPATCDWWSIGVLLYELLVGCSLRSAHPDGIGTHTVLTLPARLSVEARDLLTQLVKCNPSERLGCGPAGEEDIMSHPFFSGLDWSTISHS